MDTASFIRQVSDLLRIPKFYYDLICTAGGALFLMVVNIYIKPGFLAFPTLKTLGDFEKVLLFIALSYGLGSIISLILDSVINVIYRSLPTNRDTGKLKASIKKTLDYLKGLDITLESTTPISREDVSGYIAKNAHASNKYARLEKAFLCFKFCFTCFIFISFKEPILIPLTVSIFIFCFILRFSIVSEELYLAAILYRDRRNTNS